MRLSSSNIAVFVVIATIEFDLMAVETEDEDPTNIVTAREFDAPKYTAWDVLVSPLYIPERVLKMVLYPAARLTEWALRNSVPDRVVDIISDDTKRIWFFPAADYSSTNGLSMGGTFRFRNMFYQKKNLAIKGMFFTNLDRRFLASFGQSESYSVPLSYSISVNHDLDTDSDYYGTGIDSKRSDKSIFTRENTSVTLGAGIRLKRFRFVRISGNLGFDTTESATGRSRGTFKLVEDTFSLDMLSGFEKSIFWIRYGAGISYDTRLPGGHPNRGWLLSGRAIRFEDIHGDHSYMEFAARAATLIDLYRERNVLALGLEASAVESIRGEVPFFRQSVLDRKSPLRGYPGGRFRDKRTLLGNIEYRFHLWRTMRESPILALGTLFLDVGKPFGSVETFVEGGLLYSVGVGFILTRANGLLIRAELGYGGEGIESIISFSHAF